MMNTITAETVGLSTERLQRIGQVMQDFVDEGKLPGVITLVARHGKIAHFHVCGMMDVESKKPLRDDTLFRIYSMTKPITSIAVMMLHEQGKFLLSDPVSKFIPAFKNSKVYNGMSKTGIKVVPAERDITIHHLLTHTSGLAYDFTAEPPLDVIYKQAELHDAIFYSHLSLSEMIERAAQIPLHFHPGTRWQYSIATDVLGYLIEVVSGMPLPDFFEERIFKPLGMMETDFFVPPEKLARLATMYKLTEDGQQIMLDKPENSPFIQPNRNIRGGAGLVSTIGDYLRFVQMMYNGGQLDGAHLLSRKTIELMARNHVRPEQMPLMVLDEELPGMGFGLGFGVLLDPARAGRLGSPGEFGWGGAAATSWWIDPQEDMYAMLMTQSFRLDVFSLGDYFRTLALQSLID
jgi:CubicO group peptidase (beta-lactamase class C family)